MEYTVGVLCARNVRTENNVESVSAVAYLANGKADCVVLSVFVFRYDTLIKRSIVLPAFANILFDFGKDLA